MTSKEELIEEIAEEIWLCLGWTDMDHGKRIYCAKEIYNIMERWIVENA